MWWAFSMMADFRNLPMGKSFKKALAMIIRSFRRDKKMSSSDIALISPDVGPNLIIIYPFNLSFSVIKLLGIWFLCFK
jgi:hypothetical protein